MTTQYVRISAGSSTQFTEFDPGDVYAPIFSTGAGTPVDDTLVAALLTIAANAGVYLDVADTQWSNIPTPAPQWPFVEYVAQTLTSDQQATVLANLGISGSSSGGAVLYTEPQSLSDAQVRQVLANISAAKTITPGQFENGNDDDDWDDVLAFGASATAITFVQCDKPIYTWTRTKAWDSDHGTLYVNAYPSQIIYTGTGSALTALAHSGVAGNDPAVMKWFGGIYTALTASRFFDCTDTRSCKWNDCQFQVGNATTTPGVFIYLTNVNSFCERNEIDGCWSYLTAQTLVTERGWKATTVAVTFASGSNEITQAGHGFVAGNDEVKYATVGTSGLTANQIYYVNAVIDANNYTVSAVSPDAFGNFPTGSTVTISAASAAGTAYVYATGSFARTKVRNLSITGGVYGYAQVQHKNSGPYDSIFGPFTGNVSNGAGMVDFLNARTQGNTKYGPFLAEASDDGRKVTGDHTSNVITITNGAPASRPLAVGQAVQLTGLTGGSGVVAEATYYIKTLPTATTFTIATTPGGATVALGTDITAGFFWNTRPWIFRAGQSSGAQPLYDATHSLRNFALWDPATLNADGVTPTVPDGTINIFQQTQFVGGIAAQNSQHYSGLDIQPTPPIGNPLNPIAFIDNGTLDQIGTLVIQPAHAKGLFLLDNNGAVLLGVNHLGVISGTAITSAFGALLAVAEVDFTSAKVDFPTTGGASATDITADLNATNAALVTANALDLTFAAPSTGVVEVEMQLTVAVSGTGTQGRLQLDDVTGTPALVTNSPMVVMKGATTTQFRPVYKRRFSGLTAGQTYVWRPQWSAGASVSMTGSVGGANGPIRAAVRAWK